MVQVALSQAEFSAVQAEDLNDLYANLALTEAGTASNVGLAVSGLKSIRSVMSAEEAAPANIWSWLVAKGRQLFNSFWPAVKSVVCKLHEEQDQDTPVKDWVAKVAAAVLGVINVTAAAAVFIVTIALKLGLDALCDAE